MALTVDPVSGVFSLARASLEGSACAGVTSDSVTAREPAIASGTVLKTPRIRRPPVIGSTASEATSFSSSDI